MLNLARLITESLRNVAVMIAVFVTLPGVLLYGAYHLVSQLIAAKKTAPYQKRKANRIIWALSLLFWTPLLCYMVYSSQYKTVYHVRACPESVGIKCYQLRADMEYGEYAGVNKIYFNTGGYLEMTSCDEDDDGSFACRAANDNSFWTIDRVSSTKVKK